MCGIIGFITKEKKHAGRSARANFVQQALIVDTLRGVDATGAFYSLRNCPGRGWFKEALPAVDYITHKDYDKYVGDVEDYWYTVGHNRAATSGGLRVENAHPFTVEDVTMVHNGTLRGTQSLPLEQSKIKPKVTVDSHALAHNLAYVDPEDVREKVLAKITGAYALVWYDKRDDSLNVARNSERPLHFAQSSAQDTIFFASEASMLAFLGVRCKLNLKSIVQPTPHLHLKWKCGEIEPCEVEPYTPKSGYNSNYSGNNNSNGGKRWQRGQYSGDENNKIYAGGQYIDVPDVMQKELKEHNLYVEDRIKFTPVKITHTKKKSSLSTVLGQLDSVNLTAVIYGISKSTVDNNFDKRWLVRPIGVKHTYAEGEAPILVCRLVDAPKPENLMVEKFKSAPKGLIEDDKKAANATENDKKEESGSKKKNYSLAIPSNYFPGPDGVYIPGDQWLKKTEHGCAFCQEVFTIHDAEDVDWFDEDTPVCLECSDTMTEEDIMQYAQWGLHNYVH